MKVLRNIRFPVQEQDGLVQAIALKLSIPISDVRIERILRRAIDTRKKNQPFYEYAVLLDVDRSIKNPDLIPHTELSPDSYEPIALHDPNPFIIGMGPAGLFCALALVEQGLTPWLFDQGDRIELRSDRVRRFWQTGELDPDSNVQYGEGGAGAFSDGKLTCRTRDPATDVVFAILVKFGAPASIGYDAYPHLGTDGIRQIVREIRAYLLDRGCKFFYRSKLTDITIHCGQIKRVTINNENYSPEVMFLAVGNSARSIWNLLEHNQILMEAKPFALGFRIEHPQDYLNRVVYGSEHWSEILGAATYRLTDKSSGSYTFCMCPGGEVIAAASSAGRCVTNGMSYSRRNGRYGNSAIVTQISNLQFGAGLYRGVDFQQHIEQSAYSKGFATTVQRAHDYLHGNMTRAALTTTYKPQTQPDDLNRLFPPEINFSLKSALQKFDQIFPGLISEGTVIAPETRTSSPIRILRDQNAARSVSCVNLYPIGEGSGYAGGIISSAADGYRIGRRCIKTTEV